MKSCTVCNKMIEGDDAPVLVMGAYGNPKLLCPECSADLDEATLGEDIDKIGAAMDRLGSKMSASDPDKQTFDTLKQILESAAERAKAIERGEYDFSLDAQEDDSESFDEIPEELLETEEDRALDEQDAKRQEIFDKWFNWVSLGAVIGAVAFVVWKIVERLA